jgi:hypothetical protein
MSDNVNRADVFVTLRDVFGQPLTDEVEIIFKNLDAGSLSQRFTAKLKGQAGPFKLPEPVPAFPKGRAQVIIRPNKYRVKTFFMTVFTGEPNPNQINEVFLVDPDKARPKFMDFDDLAAKPYGDDLLRILNKSKIDKATWNGLDKRNRATILNLSAKLLKETTKGGQPLIKQEQNIDKKLLDKEHRARIYSNTDDTLLDALRKFPQRFNSVSGVLHNFPAGSTSVAPNDSFKSRDEAGNIQLTFVKDAAGAFLADIDLDDHTGLEHAFDVLKHKLSGKDTDPYDIHQILVFFQGLDPGYRLL